MNGEASEYCYTTLNYVGGMETVPVEMSIANAREARSLSWQHNGFELIQHESAVRNWDDAVAVAETHYPEMSTLAKTLTKCDVALISGHITRNPEQAQIHQDYAPIQFVHSDFTDNYGERLKQLYLSGDENCARALASAGIEAADMVRARRILILQFWRNVGEPIVDQPLAFCDAQSVPRTDMHEIHVPNYADGDFAFDTFGVTPAPSSKPHEWYTFPHMNVDEVVAFRTFDSDMVASGGSYWTPHSAFEDPNAGPLVSARRSIEVRATCLYF